jgi:hypothetical protein
MGRRCRQCGPRRSRICRQQGRVWGETIAVLAFGLSWFLKGSELFNILLVEQGRPPVLREPAPNEPAVTKQAPAIEAGTEKG